MEEMAEMVLLAEFNGGTVFFLLVVLVSTCLLLMRSHRQLGRRPVGGPAIVKMPRPAKSTESYDKRTPVEVERYEVRMHELARDLSAQLDSKMVALQELLRTADERVAQLESMLAHRSSGEDVLESPRRPATQATLAEQGSRPQQRVDAREPAKKPVLEQRYNAIYALSDAGQSSAAIAQRVGAPIGEVELILSLRNRG
jgi:hypothetical protein